MLGLSHLSIANPANVEALGRTLTTDNLRFVMQRCDRNADLQARDFDLDEGRDADAYRSALLEVWYSFCGDTDDGYGTSDFAYWLQDGLPVHGNVLRGGRTLLIREPRTSDGFRFTMSPDGTWTDGDMTFPSSFSFFSACPDARLTTIGQMSREVRRATFGGAGQ